MVDTLRSTKLVNTKHDGVLSHAHEWRFYNLSVCATQIEWSKTSLVLRLGSFMDSWQTVSLAGRQQACISIYRGKSRMLEPVFGAITYK